MKRRRVVAAAAVTLVLTGSPLEAAVRRRSTARPSRSPCTWRSTRGHGDAAADGLQHRRQHLGARRRLRRPGPLRPGDHRAVPLRRREHRDHGQPGVDDHDQARPDVPERRAGRRRGVRPGLELRRLRPQRDGQQLLLRALRGLRRDAGRDRRRRQRHRRTGGRHAVGPDGRRPPDARGHAQRPVRRLLHDARLHRLLPDRPGVPRRHRGVRRPADRQRPVPDRRVAAGREPDRQQVGGLHARRDPELRPDRVDRVRRGVELARLPGRRPRRQRPATRRAGRRRGRCRPAVALRRDGPAPP